MFLCNETVFTHMKSLNLTQPWVYIKARLTRKKRSIDVKYSFYNSLSFSSIDLLLHNLPFPADTQHQLELKVLNITIHCDFLCQSKPSVKKLWSFFLRYRTWPNYHRHIREMDNTLAALKCHIYPSSALFHKEMAIMVCISINSQLNTLVPFLLIYTSA